MSGTICTLEDEKEASQQTTSCVLLRTIFEDKPAKAGQCQLLSSNEQHEAGSLQQRQSPKSYLRKSKSNVFVFNSTIF